MFMGRDIRRRLNCMLIFRVDIAYWVSLFACVCEDIYFYTQPLFQLFSFQQTNCICSVFPRVLSCCVKVFLWMVKVRLAKVAGSLWAESRWEGMGTLWWKCNLAEEIRFSCSTPQVKLSSQLDTSIWTFIGSSGYLFLLTWIIIHWVS